MARNPVGMPGNKDIDSTSGDRLMHRHVTRSRLTAVCRPVVINEQRSDLKSVSVTQRPRVRLLAPYTKLTSAGIPTNSAIDHGSTITCHTRTLPCARLISPGRRLDVPPPTNETIELL